MEEEVNEAVTEFEMAVANLEYVKNIGVTKQHDYDRVNHCRKELNKTLRKVFKELEKVTIERDAFRSLLKKEDL